MCKITTLDKISAILVILSGINWGIIGLLNINLFSLLLGGSIILLRMLYIVILIGTLDIIYLFYRLLIK